jgi:phosphohistidine swiveling domain-containing protein
VTANGSGFCVNLGELTAPDLPRAGGKAVALGRLARGGLTIPDGLCVTTGAYDRYLDETGLRQRLPLLLERKAFGEMRWEELWDLGLRVRNLFLVTPLPEALAAELTAALSGRFAGVPVTVRSSAPAEDSAAASFAGLHDTFVNVLGPPAILDRLRLVWASLWSDRALLYRQELGLDPRSSAMAVIIQELVVGECSGVAFSRCPGRERLAVIETVWGLNQGLVDGDVAPDRLLLDRRTGSVVETQSPRRERACRPAGSGVALQALSAHERVNPPLSAGQAGLVWGALRQAEALFDTPQDMEWTLRGRRLFVLQSRPITTAAETGKGGERGWYLSLHRSFAALKELRRVIEEEWLPATTGLAAQLKAVDLTILGDAELAAAIGERRDALAAAEASYRELCIPMAHGIRLFGEVYNDRLRPADPFAFLQLLSGDGGLLAVQRNRALAELAAGLRKEPGQLAALRRGEAPTGAVAAALADFTGRFGELSWAVGSDRPGMGGMLALLLEMASPPAADKPLRSPADEAVFLAAFAPDEQGYALELLEIGRASYRLRDNDNLAIGQLTACLEAARAEAAARLAVRDVPVLAGLVAPARGRVPRRIAPAVAGTSRRAVAGMRLSARQLVGQPAGPGLVSGLARVIRQPADLAAFRSGEILVCDAVDPNMTFVVPLAAGIVERRGGMLIHGAIIAREYGLPCVTGVPEAVSLIATGDRLTVDGFLGVVIIAKGSPSIGTT